MNTGGVRMTRTNHSTNHRIPNNPILTNPSIAHLLNYAKQTQFPKAESALSLFPSRNYIKTTISSKTKNKPNQTQFIPAYTLAKLEQTQPTPPIQTTPPGAIQFFLLPSYFLLLAFSLSLYSSSPGRLRCCLSRLLRLFSSSRRRFAYAGIAVLFRTRLVAKASPSNSTRRSTAALRFAPAVRCRCDATCITPSRLALPESFFRMRRFCGSVRLGDSATLNHTVMRVLSLLTFCPPGPPLRELLKRSSFSSIATRSVTLISPTSPFGFPCRRGRRRRNHCLCPALAARFELNLVRIYPHNPDAVDAVLLVHYLVIDDSRRIVIGIENPGQQQLSTSRCTYCLAQRQTPHVVCAGQNTHNRKDQQTPVQASPTAPLFHKLPHFGLSGNHNSLIFSAFTPRHDHGAARLSQNAYRS